MNYSEALEKIDSLLVFGSQPGLERISRLLELMGDPQDKLRYVHVAGTNGKGSVCNMLAGVLREAGLKTGLFTSPHITGFGERMQINGEQITEAETAALVGELFPIVERLRAEGVIITEFEFVTAMAFRWFCVRRCDVVVLETGLGGRFDATNVIKKPLCSVITSISLDHTAVLGDTLGKIAFEKSGIIKEGSRTVFAPAQHEVNEVIIGAAKERGNSLHIAPQLTAEGTGISGTTVKYGDLTVTIPLPGAHQLKNLALVLAAAEALRLEGVSIGTEDIRRGVESVRLPARFEVLRAEPPVVVDGAHNPGGMKALAEAIDDCLSGRQLVCVIGMLRDKDCASALRYIEGKTAKVFATTIPDSPRRQTAQQLCDTLRSLGFDAEPFEDPKAAADAAFDAASHLENSAVLVCGSLYLAADLRTYISEKYCQ